MKSFARAVVVGMLLALFPGLGSITSPAWGQGGVVRKPAQELVEALTRYAARKGGHEVAEELAKAGGEVAIREVAERALREGGEESLAAFARLTRAHGAELVRAAQQSRNLPAVLRAVEELPSEMIGPAARRLAAGAQGQALAEAVEQYGAKVLRAEVQHPGVGGRLVKGLGEEGAALANRLPTSDAIEVARHVDDVARLVPEQKAGVLRLLHDDAQRTVAFLGRFARDNPGKVLFTAAGTSLVLANREALLGGGNIVIGPDGQPVFVPKQGMVERLAHSVLGVVLPVLAAALAAWAAIRLWFVYRMGRLKYQAATRRE